MKAKIMPPCCKIVGWDATYTFHRVSDQRIHVPSYQINGKVRKSRKTR